MVSSETSFYSAKLDLSAPAFSSSPEAAPVDSE